MRGDGLQASDSRNRPLRVLVVDDERDTVMTLGILLRSEGIDVRLVDGGAKVSDAVAEFQPDAVLMDIGMPDRSGLQVALELTRQYGAKRPVLIALTAFSDETARRLTAKSGFEHHIPKPYDFDGLLQLVSSVRPRT